MENDESKMEDDLLDINVENKIVDTKPYIYTVGLTFQSIQRVRIALELSLRTRKNAPTKRVEMIYKALTKTEELIVGYMVEEAEKCPAWPWLSAVPGIGPRTGGMLISLIDIHKAPTVSSLWRYAGLAVINGKAERRTKGEKIKYNIRLKKTCFLVGRQLIMCNNSVYAPIYREAKERYFRERPEWTKKHVDMAARRVMVKMLLSHLWVIWRAAESLPIREPYVNEYMGHRTNTPPTIESWKQTKPA